MESGLEWIKALGVAKSQTAFQWLQGYNLVLEWVLLEVPLVCLEGLGIPYSSWFVAKCCRVTGVFRCLRFTKSSTSMMPM